MTSPVKSRFATLNKSLEGLDKHAHSDVQLLSLSTDVIDEDPNNVRSEFDDGSLNELADSIRSQGLIEALNVFQKDDGRYQLIAGHRRLRAARLAGLSRVDCILRRHEGSSLKQLVENIQREDLSPVDVAKAIESELSEHGDKARLAKECGKSASWVSQHLAILKFNTDVIEIAQARLVTGYNNLKLINDLEPETRAQVIAELRAAKPLGEVIAHMAAQTRSPGSLTGRTQSATRSASTPDPDIERLNKRLAEFLASKVAIRHGSKGSGKLIISYESVEILQGILEKIGIRDD